MPESSPFFYNNILRYFPLSPGYQRAISLLLFFIFPFVSISTPCTLKLKKSGATCDNDLPPMLTTVVSKRKQRVGVSRMCKYIA